MEAARLETYYRRICENEKNSRLRNEQLLRDLDRIENHTMDLQRKSLQLYTAKADYESYLESRYPQWKEKALQRLNEWNVIEKSNTFGQYQQPALNRESQPQPNLNTSNGQVVVDPVYSPLNTNDTLLSHHSTTSILNDCHSTESALNNKNVNNQASFNGALHSRDNISVNRAPLNVQSVAIDHKTASTSNRGMLHDSRAEGSLKKGYLSTNAPAASQAYEIIPSMFETSSVSIQGNNPKTMPQDTQSDVQQKSARTTTDTDIASINRRDSSNKAASNVDNNFTAKRPMDSFTITPPEKSRSGALSPQGAAKSPTTPSANNATAGTRDTKKSKTGPQKSILSPRQTGLSSAVGSMGAAAVIIASPTASIVTGVASPHNSVDNARVSFQGPASVASGTLHDSVNMTGTPRSSRNVKTTPRNSVNMTGTPCDSVITVDTPRNSLDITATPRNSVTGFLDSIASEAGSPRRSFDSRPTSQRESVDGVAGSRGSGGAGRGDSPPHQFQNISGSLDSESASPQRSNGGAAKPVESSDFEDLHDNEIPKQTMAGSEHVQEPQILEQTDRTEIDDASDFESDISLTNHQPPIDPLSSFTLSANHTPANISMPNQSESTWTNMQATNRENDDNADFEDDDWDDFSGGGRDAMNFGVSHAPSKMASLTQLSAYRQLLADVTSSREGGVGLSDLHTETETEDEIERNLKSHHDAKHGSLMATLNSTAGSRQATAASGPSSAAAAVTPRSSRSAIQSITEDADLEDDFSPPQSLSYLNSSNKANKQQLQSPCRQLSSAATAAAAAAAATARAIAGDDFWD